MSNFSKITVTGRAGPSPANVVNVPKRTPEERAMSQRLAAGGRPHAVEGAKTPTQPLTPGMSYNFLHDPNLTMIEIAEAMGFYNQSHFSHQFKKMMGVSPTDFRKRLFGQQNLPI